MEVTKKYKIWTKEEEEFIIENYQKISQRKMAEILELDYDQIRGKVTYMRLTGRLPKANRKYINKNEEEKHLEKIEKVEHLRRIRKKDREVIEKIEIKYNLQSQINLLDGNLTVGRKYKVTQLNRDGKKSKGGNEFTGVLEEKYKDYYLFRNYRGFRECFLKKDFVIGEYEIKEVK